MPTKSKDIMHLDCENIRCIRGDNTLFSELSIKVKSGELLRIRGENGSGKTSLLKIIAGINSPEEGNILWNKNNINQSDDYAHCVAYLAHRDGIKAELSTLDNLRFYEQFYQQVTNTALEKILEELDLLHTVYIAAGKLSFGQRRRLAFARLLLSDAKLWLLDEPFTGVDIQGRQRLEKLCLDFMESGGMIVMTHHAELENNDLRKKERSIELHKFNPLHQATTLN